MREFSDEHKRAEDGRVKITREIPLWSIITFLFALAMQCITLYQGFQKTTEATTLNTAEIQKLITQVTAMTLRGVEVDVRIVEIDRRVMNHDSRLTELERLKRR